MGTRHYQRVIDRNGKTVVAQYGQWDGYPEGQGKDILHFLSSVKLDAYEQALTNVRKMTKEDEKDFEKFGKDWDESDPSHWKVEYPQLSRDTGSRIHWLILSNQVKFVSHTDAKEALQWCEGFYTINFKDRTFTSEFHGDTTTYSLDELPSAEQYLADMGHNI